MTQRNSDFFIMGLFSLIDVLLGRPMEDVIKDLPISDDVKDALMGVDNIFRKAFDIIISYEEGKWDKVDKATSKINISELKYPRYYLESVEWANKVYSPNP